MTGDNLQTKVPPPSPSGILAEQSWFLLAAIIDSCQDAIISKNLDGIITSWNPAATRIFGYLPEEMIGQSITRLIPEELVDEEPEILAKMRAGERIEQYETVRVTKAGERIDLSLTISPIRDDTGKIIGASKIAHDISERKRSEEVRLRLAAIVESSDDAIIGMDLNGIITSWNEAAHRMFGYIAEEILGRPILRIIPEELHPEEAEILRKLSAGERIEHYETTRLAKSGKKLEVSLTISSIRDSHGRVIGTSKIARDISLRKQMERLLLQSEKLAATGRMAATIAHEINNPLESVMNLIYLAGRSCPEGSEAHNLLHTAEKEVERVSRIARQTLGYYRDHGMPAAVYLHDLIEDVLKVYQSKFYARGIQVERVFEKCRPVIVSKGELVQVFSNIIANSVDAMQHGGVLRVQIAETPGGEGVRVAIQDHGIGIAQEHLAKIFEPFFTTKSDAGTGIGLWITRQLVENRGGSISVTSSTEPGSSGTTIRIEIPFVHSRPGLTSGLGEGLSLTPQP